ncbi:tyrosine-type recombinase/integrase [Paenalcaligenes faecalis]|uniref:tyrosine-type recombinase/integrase n=1 Tax=Paenalcaligenes faecalis TaxID=2980099 RepID=UPI0022B962F4|nr:site-specific integrase [Paenalcaligenes faecalis]
MTKLTSKLVAAKVKGEPGSFADGNGLYLVVPKRGRAYWSLRYTAHSKRKQMTLAPVDDLSLADARAEAALKKKQLRDGLDPLIAKKQAEYASIHTVDELFADWHEGNVRRLKHHQIPQRVYMQDIAPVIGEMQPSDVTGRDIKQILQNIVESNRPTVANDALLYCKQLFNHAIKLDLIVHNPAFAFSVDDAGGVEKSRDRALSFKELTQVFKKFREESDSFTRDNYLACALLVLLGVRKGELTEATWSEFHLKTKTWYLPSERSKSGVAIDIPLPDLAIQWLDELKVRSLGSDYVFPNRRSSKMPHMGKDTLNRAIAKLFGREPGRAVQPENKMGDIAYFTVHDLRRTCRSLLAAIGVPGHVAERCLNHALKGVEGIYNRHDYFDERKEALELLAKKLEPII